MTEHELERMISLADDKYIEEVFEQNIQIKNRFPVAIPFVAAAVVCGLFFAARPTETKIENMVASESTGVTTAVEELDEYNENLRYWKYFDGDDDTALPRGTPPDFIYAKILIPNDYTEEIVNFDFGYRPSGAVIYVDENNVPNNLTFSINAGKTKEGFEKTALFGINNAYEITEKEEHFMPEILNGVEIYGYETEAYLCADFIMNEQMYSIDFSNIGYKEAVEIIEMVIESKISIADFDISKGTILTQYKLGNLSFSFLPYLAAPVEGEISAPYGHLQSNFHKGIDFRADEGTPVYSAADGIVIEPVDVDTGDGKNVIISHYTNVNTFYAHLSKVIVNEGDKVKQGDLIGYVGSTGESTGPHLHFELCIDGEYVDQIDYFSDQAKSDILLQNELGMHELLESEFSQIHLPNQPTEN